MTYIGNFIYKMYLYSKNKKKYESVNNSINTQINKCINKDRNLYMVSSTKCSKHDFLIYKTV